MLRRKTGRLLVVHEDNLTCGFGAEVAAAAAEAVPGLLQVRRVTRPDTWVPCNFSNQLEILPSFRRILLAAADMLDLEVHWKAPAAEQSVLTIEAAGSSPLDQTVTVVSWNVVPGQAVRAEQTLAVIETDKAVFDLPAPASGIVEDIKVPAGATIPVHTPLLTIKLNDPAAYANGGHMEHPGEPILRVRQRPPAAADA